MNTNLPPDAADDAAQNSTSTDTQAASLASIAAAAKQKTVDALKTFEARKASASASLKTKWAEFETKLSTDEIGELGLILDTSGNTDESAVDKVFLKPMQVHTDGDGVQSVFLKPMQRAAEAGEQAVFLKPMQRQADAGEEAVFLKPMQVHTDGDGVQSVFLKPMQRTAEAGEQAVFLKPMQRQVDAGEDAVFRKPMQVHIKKADSVFLKPMQAHTDGDGVQSVFLKPMQVPTMPNFNTGELKKSSASAASSVNLTLRAGMDVSISINPAPDDTYELAIVFMAK